MDWFNAVDATYRSDLRDLNEVNFARFDAKLEQRFAEQDAKWEQRFAEQDAKWEHRFADLESKMDRRFAELKVELLRWMFAFWTAQMLALVAFMWVALRPH